MGCECIGVILTLTLSWQKFICWYYDNKMNTETDTNTISRAICSCISRTYAHTPRYRLSEIQANEKTNRVQFFDLVMTSETSRRVLVEIMNVFCLSFG